MRETKSVGTEVEGELLSLIDTIWEISRNLLGISS